MSTLWEACLKHLEKDVPPQQINTWIRPLQADFSNNELNLFAPNKFVLDWVIDNYKDKITNIINEIEKESVQLFISIGSKKTLSQSSFKAPKNPVKNSDKKHLLLQII